MNRKITLFSLLIVSVLVFTSFADVAFAGKIKVPRRQKSPLPLPHKHQEHNSDLI